MRPCHRKQVVRIKMTEPRDKTFTSMTAFSPPHIIAKGRGCTDAETISLTLLLRAYDEPVR
jgi:hypothetical protein